jgi:arsenate reductase (thioredoxin)
MAEGFAKKFGLAASSAGTFPSTHINSLVVDAMNEVGVDISQNDTKELTGKMIDAAKVVVLTDASLEKSIPGDLRRKMRKKVVQWSLPDPQGKSIDEIRYIRDEIQGLVRDMAKNPSGISP